MTFTRMWHLNINVSDMERSIAFYEWLGFTVVNRIFLDVDECAALCRAFGAEPSAGYATLIRLGDDVNAACIDLVQWTTTPTEGETYKKVNNRGIYRIAFEVDNADEMLKKLSDRGIDLLGPPAKGRTEEGTDYTVFAFKDPDGTVLEVISGFNHLVKEKFDQEGVYTPMKA